MGETGLTHDIFFFEFSLRPFEVVEAKGGCLVHSTLQGLIIGTEKRQMLVLRHF